MICAGFEYVLEQMPRQNIPVTLILFSINNRTAAEINHFNYPLDAGLLQVPLLPPLLFRMQSQTSPWASLNSRREQRLEVFAHHLALNWVIEMDDDVEGVLGNVIVKD